MGPREQGAQYPRLGDVALELQSLDHQVHGIFVSEQAECVLPRRRLARGARAGLLAVDAEVEAPGFVDGLAGAAAEHTDWWRDVMGETLKQGHLVTLKA